MTEVPKPKTKGRGSQSFAKNQKPRIQSLNQIAALANNPPPKKIPKSLPYKSKNQKAKTIKYHAVTFGPKTKIQTSPKNRPI